MPKSSWNSPAASSGSLSLTWRVEAKTLCNRILVSGATALTCIVMLAGCGETSGSTLTGGITLPAKNVDQWVMPLDQFMPFQTANSDYAENLLIQPCMEAAGYEWTIPAHDVKANDGASWNEAGTRLFNPALAARWGYHLAPANDSSILANRAFSAAHSALVPAEENAFDSCIKSARKTLPVLPGSSQVAETYFGDAWVAAKKYAKVLSSAKKWRACMAPSGISDLPKDPQDMPSDSLTDKFQIHLETSPVPPVVSAGEIRIATADINCQDSSGYRLAYYNAQWKEEVKALKESADALERARTMNLEANKKALQIISEHVPNG